MSGVGSWCGVKVARPFLGTDRVQIPTPVMTEHSESEPHEMSRSFTHYLDVVEILKETEAAFGVEIEDMVGIQWIPKSQIRNLKEGLFGAGDKNCTFEIPYWLAEEKGLV